MDKTENNKIPFWTLAVGAALIQTATTADGLTTGEASKRLTQYGTNTLNTQKQQTALGLFLSQFKSPVTMILLFAAILSFFLQDHIDAIIILVIILFSTLLGFWQERNAGNAVARLLELIHITCTVIRDKEKKEIPIEQVVPGDIINLSAGDVIPADSLILTEDELFIDEASFTGETFPVKKQAGILPQQTPLGKRTNSLFMGSHVVSGTGTALVMATGMNTEFGHISQSITHKAPLTDFERGVKRFGYLLMQITLVMVILIFGINVMLHKPILDSLLFTLAIAVGLTPQLLPAIITVNLSQGAKKMAQKKVVVKRLNSIENFGNMNVLCSDKTGTLTKGKIIVNKAVDYKGNESTQAMLLAKINAAFQQGFKNPIDLALNEVNTIKIENYTRVDEIPYDFIRKRLSLVVKSETGSTQLVTKGAVSGILQVCTEAIDKDGNVVPIAQATDTIQHLYEQLSAQGFRTLGVATKNMSDTTTITPADEANMTFTGFITLFDPPKEGVTATLNEIKEYGVDFKIITGDNALIAKSVSTQIGLANPVILTGEEITQMSDEAFTKRAVDTNIFAEVEPNQKEKIILALKKAGKVCGYMGDGINDVSAIHAADVGLSVDTAVDVTKEAADIVLLDPDLGVLIEGVKEGRRTFANTQKYIFMATSANFGNMFSMAGASLFLSFLPLLPKQILLTNLLTDLPSMAISSDNVDEEWIKKPRSWNLGFIKRFMIVFGILSSVFDYLTFAVLLLLLHAGEKEFQTGWFLESVVSATIIVLVVRTRRTFYKSRPGKLLLTATLVVAAFVLLIPNLPFAGLLGFTPLPLIFYPAMLSIVALYIFFAETTKKWFYKHND